MWTVVLLGSEENEQNWLREKTDVNFCFWNRLKTDWQEQKLDTGKYSHRRTVENVSYGVPLALTILC